MAFTYQELKKKTVAQLREIAKGLESEAVKGYSQLNKEHLLVAVCKALSIDTKVHHVASGIDKTKIKSQIKLLKKERDEILAASEKNYKRLSIVRNTIHRLKRALRKASF
ncbi:MAG: Rho termination factor N-terminal domain-containing protein [Chitinispirillaceae bacterium]|jgi:arsenate reductase-like glutaredoxin family protein|nr:Rho termination factor N-terminal domain-containing protein [Chitinispirillaceae bacterium]